MPLNVNDMLKKADKKGYNDKANEKKAPSKNIKPWQEDSITHSSHGQDPKNNLIIELNPEQIINWKFHDRPESELGDIEDLAKDFLAIGQQQPCIVRNYNNDKDKFELIIGERRWRAAKEAGINVKCIISKYTDTEAALAQATENDRRLNLSDYAKGMSFSRQLNKGIIKQKDLIDRLGKSKQYISSLLSFSKIPASIVDAIGDMAKVSARTAETIKQLSSKGDEYIDALIKKAPQIREGKLGNRTLPAAINKELNKGLGSPSLPKSKVFNKENRHMFTWRTDNNGLPAIHLPKTVVEAIDIKKLTNKLINVLEQAVKENDNEI